MAQLKSLKDQPGTSREYETIFILRADTSNEAIATVNARLKGIVEGMGGKILKADNWGKRKLAYEVQKQLKGIYLYWQYLAVSGTVEEFERNLRMLDSVVRYLTVKRQANMVPDQVATEVTEESYEKAAATAADEEDMYLRRPEGEGDEESAAGGYGDDYGDDDDFTEDAKEEEPAEEDDSKKDEE